MPSTACLNGNCSYCDGCDHDCHTDQPSLFDPVRPYTQDGQKSAGWSGTETSKAGEPLRAESQKQVHQYVWRQTSHGATVKEVREATGQHHGVASGALSVLHKKGYLARLTIKRDGCRVYVHPDYLGGREHD